MKRSKSCPCGKVRFRDHEEAVAVLHRITVIRRRARDQAIPCRREEVRAYGCTMCNGHHLTSKVAA